MNPTAVVPLAAKAHMSGQQTVAILILLVLFLGWAVYTVLAVLRRDPGEPAGSEVELAPNRKPYYEDDELEGPRLDRALLFAFGMLCVIAIALPLYWFREPGRAKNEEARFNRGAVERGSGLFMSAKAPIEPQSFTNSGIHFGCADCHGSKGQGGQANYVIQDLAHPDLPPVQVVWQAPPLNTVLLRFKEDDSANPPVQELRQIIVYGRPGTPMPAWGINGGGSLDDQQINDLIQYLQSIQLTPAQAKADWDSRAQTTAKAENLAYPNPDPLINGKILFDTNCARCHTKGWSYATFVDGVPTSPVTNEPLVDGGGGQYAPNLTNGVEIRQFPNESGQNGQIDFVTNGVDPGKQYGTAGIMSDYGGGMPHFGAYLTPQEIKEIVDFERSL